MSFSYRRGMVAKIFHQLDTLSSSHFSRLSRASRDVNLVVIIKVACLFPRFVHQEAEENLLLPVTMGELEGTLKWFKNDKIPGLDGWSIEFYLAFFDMLGNDLL